MAINGKFTAIMAINGKFTAIMAINGYYAQNSNMDFL